MQQAADWLESHLLQYSGNAEYDSLLGEVWYQQGKTGEALFAFERVLIADPNNIEVRLKAARISTERGNDPATQALLAPLADRPLTPAQQQAVTQIRQQKLTAGESSPTSIRGYLAGGLSWDDNVTGGPNLSSVIIPAISIKPTSLGTSTKNSDLIGTMEAGVAVRKGWGARTWLTADGALHQGLNQSRKDVAEGLANLNLGIIQRAGADFVGVAALMQNYMVSNATYRKSQGLRFNWLHPLNDHANLAAYIQQIAFQYPTRSTDDATRNLVGGTYQTIAEDTHWTMLYGLYLGMEMAKDQTKPHFSFEIMGLNLGSQLILTPDCTISAGLAYEQHRHTSKDALFHLFRSDAQHVVAVSADYRLMPNWHLLPRYTYTHNVSNIALYDYIRNTFTLQLKWDFDNEKQ